MNGFEASLERMRLRLPALVGYAVPFLLLLYLGLEAGGYELVTRSQIGILAWWGVLLGVAAGLLPAIRITRVGWILLAIMIAFTAWTALALLWTQSTERTMIELGRTLTLTGVLLLLILVQGRDGLRRSLGALAAASALVAVVALASRFHPAWFDLPQFPESYPKARLNHPVGYWNGLATLMAMGLAALLWSAAFARSRIGRALSAAAIPLLVLATYLTASRGGAIEAAAAIALLLVITPGRVSLVSRSVVPAALSLVLIWLIEQRPELRDNLGGVAESQGDEMIWLTFAALLVGFGLAWVVDRALGERTRPVVSRRTMQAVGGVLAVVVGLVLLAGLASGFIGDRWDEFKQPVDDRSATVERLSSVNSGERYEQWRSAVDAGETEVLTGLGPGAYEYWWSRNGTGPGFVRDAHSFYLEGFAELGIPGLLLTLALVLFPIGLAIKRATRNADDERRPAFAAAAAGMVAFAVGAGIDWAWELTVLPVAFFVLAAATCGASSEVARGRLNDARLRLPFLVPARVGIGAASLVAAAVIAVPMLSEQRVSDSQASYREGEMERALDQARSAHDLAPWSARASIQIALLEIEAGNGSAALAAARDAVDFDPYNWQAWYVLSEVAKTAEDRPISASASERMVELNRNLRGPNQ